MNCESGKDAYSVLKEGDARDVPVLELRSVEKSFKSGVVNTKIIEESSVQIFRGETVVLIGRSGCGKTTLLQLCGLLDSPSGGDVVINGVSSKSLSSDKKAFLRRNNIGFVYQLHHLFPEFTVHENIALPLMIKGITNYKRDIEQLLERLNLYDKTNCFPSQLSGGERQRVAVARAIVARPSLLLADEPTGNLDEDNSTNVMNLLIEYTKESNASLLVVSHNLKLAKNFDKIITICDRLVQRVDSLSLL